MQITQQMIDLIADPSSQDEYRRTPGDPAWCFFDDNKEQDPLEAWFRAEAEALENWNITKALAHLPASRIVRFKDPVTNNPTFVHEDAYETPVDHKLEEHSERMESLRYCNWYLNMMRGRMQKSEDLFKRAGELLVKKNPKELEILREIIKDTGESAVNAPGMDEEFHWLKKLVNGATEELIMKEAPDDDLKMLCEIRKALKEQAPEEFKPIMGTVFVNPDGTRYVTKGTDPMKAKQAFCKRHSKGGEFVSVDRVQKEGERGSWWIVGVRGHSAERSSHYIDMQPAFKDVFLNGKWEHQYDPNAAITLQEWESTTIPEGAYRLTVRDFERALLAGANIEDDEYSTVMFEATRYDIEGETFDDMRERGSYNEFNHEGDGRKVMEEDLTDDELLVKSALEKCSTFSKDAFEEAMWKQFALRMLYVSGRAGFVEDLQQEIGKDNMNIIKLMRAVKSISEDPEAIEGAVKLLTELSEDEKEIATSQAGNAKRLRDGGFMAVQQLTAEQLKQLQS